MTPDEKQFVRIIHKTYTDPKITDAIDAAFRSQIDAVDRILQKHGKPAPAPMAAQDCVKVVETAKIAAPPTIV